MTKQNTRILLIAQMKRAIELLEDLKILDAYSYKSGFAELENKLHEIRRDSIRFSKESRDWTPK